jgi:hypothetical protein
MVFVTLGVIGEAKMETQPQESAPIVKVAWTKFGQLDTASGKRSRSYERMRRWIAIFGVLSVLFAILTELYPSNFPVLGGVILKFLLISSPITASALAAYVNKFYSSGDWLITRAGAEEVLKDIYMFRTILQTTSIRRAWLEQKLSDIQHSVYRGMNGELVMEAYEGALPPLSRFNPKDPNDDAGFKDLTGEEYFKYRLNDQLTWHVKKVNQKQKERVRLQVLIISSGVVGAILAALGGGFTLWVALAASLTTTFIGWQELRNLDVVVRNYSKVIMELTILSDHWQNLEEAERTQSEFYKMVNNTEEILWSRNVEYIKAMQEALKESDLEQEASLINRVIQEQRESDRRFKQSMEDAIVDQTTTSMKATEDTLSEKFKEALGSLAEEASSEVVQAELAAIRDAIQDAAQNIAEHIGLSSSLKAIQAEFDGVEIGRDTPRSVLNDLMSRFPKTTDAKG